MTSQNISKLSILKQSKGIRIKANQSKANERKLEGNESNANSISMEWEWDGRLRHIIIRYIPVSLPLMLRLYSLVIQPLSTLQIKCPKYSADK